MKKQILLFLFLVFCGEKTFASSKIVHFGELEVRQGVLHVAEGQVLHPEDEVLLKINIPEVANFARGENLLGSTVHVYFRFNDGEEFKELSDLPRGNYEMRGPMIFWDKLVPEVQVKIPANAHRLELYAQVERIAYTGCYLAYDMSECPDYYSINSGYVSNYGNNFKIEVIR